jgi:hypothetical protein
MAPSASAGAPQGSGASGPAEQPTRLRHEFSQSSSGWSTPFSDQRAQTSGPVSQGSVRGAARRR